MGLPDNVLQRWKDSEDSFMIALREGYIKDGLPTQDEAVLMLAYFLRFSIGCTKLGCKELPAKYEKRATLYTVGLEELGFKRGWTGLGKKTRERGGLETIIARASGAVGVSYTG